MENKDFYKDYLKELSKIALLDIIANTLCKLDENDLEALEAEYIVLLETIKERTECL